MFGAKYFQGWTSKICEMQPLGCIPQILLGPFFNTLSFFSIFFRLVAFPMGLRLFYKTAALKFLKILLLRTSVILQNQL